MVTGTIKFYNKAKGFGFVTADTGGKEIFLPSASLTASGLKNVEPGQRVSFEEEADKRGPKAVALKLLDEPRVREIEPRVREAEPRMREAAPRASESSHVTLYHDPASPTFEIVQDALSDLGIEAVLVDYIAAPPTPEQLKQWSLALSGNAGLVRRSDSMFYALQLDDRFTSESDFWLAISQHPNLINGPVLKKGDHVSLAKTEADVRRFIGQDGPAAAKPKTISPRLSALIRGVALPPPPPVETAKAKAEPPKEPPPENKIAKSAKPSPKAKPAIKKAKSQPVASSMKAAKNKPKDSGRARKK